ncbi:MAG: histidine triad nucleotide-binding protein [Oscillospiraceae bacterium]|jgi:histidine triad (HIT) family protein|nr:histidine triad nucleotide-binding protein [Oscillospiraceae bacterium]
MDCLFCAIAAGSIPADKVYEDELCCVFRDIDPKAPVHLLAIPREHIAGASAVDEKSAPLAGHLMAAVAKAAKNEGLTSYRVVSNCGPDAGQTVNHLHYHILGGRELSWPPG